MPFATAIASYGKYFVCVHAVFANAETGSPDKAKALGGVAKRTETPIWISGVGAAAIAL
jgi:hypothetical protein